MKRHAAWWRRQKQLAQAVGFLLAAAAVPFCLMLVAVALVTLEGGYRPAGYIGTIDPVRASLGLFLTLGAAAFLLWTMAALELLALRPGLTGAVGVILPLGVAIACGVFGISILVVPASEFSAPVRVAPPLAAALGAAGVLLFAGFFYLVALASVEAARSRDFTRLAAAILMLVVAGGVLAMIGLAELDVLAQVLGNNQP